MQRSLIGTEYGKAAEEALARAKSTRLPSAIYKLAEYCESEKRLTESLNAWQEIDIGNLHYKEANFKAAHIIMLRLHDEEKNTG
jgi:hypothetical protein